MEQNQLAGLPHMLSAEMAMIARQNRPPQPSIDDLLNDAQDAIGRAQTLLVYHLNDPNAVMLELNLAFGLLETISQNAPMMALETQLLP